jgi:AcrR family transcriptional regulator
MVKQEAPMTPKDTEADIIAAAREVFLEVGYDGARMQAIADRAGINKALLHYYYKSKEHLFSTSWSMSSGASLASCG